MGMGMMGQMMGGGMAPGLAWMAGSLLVFLLLLGGGVLLFSWLSQERSAPKQKFVPPPSRLKALKERYIAGEITLEEFEEGLPGALEQEQAQERSVVSARRRG